MSWSRTLAELTSDVTDRCDVTGYTARHPTATVRRRVIESYQALRDLMTSLGSKRWIVGPISLNASSAAISTWVNIGYAVRCPLVSSAALPGPWTMTPYERPQLIEAYVSGQWRELKPIALGEMHDWYQQSGMLGQPQAWAFSGDVDGEATNAESTYGGQFSVFITPAFDPAGYPIRFYAQSVINVTDEDATSLTLDGPGFEWIIWDSVVKIVVRDSDQASIYAIASAERQRVEDRIIKGIQDERRNVVQRRDVFHGQSRFGRPRRF
jgi:hypothetical protein